MAATFISRRNVLSARDQKRRGLAYRDYLVSSGGIAIDKARVMVPSQSIVIAKIFGVGGGPIKTHPPESWAREGEDDNQRGFRRSSSWGIPLHAGPNRRSTKFRAGLVSPLLPRQLEHPLLRSTSFGEDA